MIKNIFFDFDGVIAESVNVKTEAFRKLYESYGAEISTKVVEHHMANGGMSRFEKFRHYHKEFLGELISEDKVASLANEFSNLVLVGVINAPQVDGSHDFLKNNHENYNCYVITGTPTEEAREIVKARGLASYFKGVYGSPEKKDHWSDFILNQKGYQIEETVFVGDALADYNAAKVFDMTFLLRECEDNKFLFEGKNVDFRFQNFEEFESIVKSIK